MVVRRVAGLGSMGSARALSPRTVAALGVVCLGSCGRHVPALAEAPPDPLLPRPGWSDVQSHVQYDDEDAARRLVQTWSDALDRHDLVALESVYDERVRFYGHDLERGQVLTAKRAALGPHSRFHQTIVGDIDVRPGEHRTWVAAFTKRSGRDASLHTARGRLVLRAQDAGVLLVVEETDEATEDRADALERAKCEEVAAREVNALPAVQQAVKSAQRAASESDGEAHFGGMMPIEDDDSFTGEIGVNSESRFEAEVIYSVDRSGRLTVNALGEDQVVAADALARVKRACKR
jgi:hypothetical protein